jgi:hypothetical protein
MDKHLRNLDDEELISLVLFKGDDNPMVLELAWRLQMLLDELPYECMQCDPELGR